MTRNVVVVALGLVVSLFAANHAAAQYLEKKTVSLALAKKMAVAAEAEATKNNWTMVIAIVDDGGNLVYLGRMDGTQIGSIEVAQGKSQTALRFKRPTKALQDVIDNNQPHVITLDHITGVQGGLPILLDGKVIGAIGASGGTSAQDEQCAQAGLNSLTEK
jgi:glc operon protein GlcG